MTRRPRCFSASIGCFCSNCFGNNGNFHIVHEVEVNLHFLLTEGIDRYDPFRFLDYKLRRVGSWEERPTFEDLAVMFEGSASSGAERAYTKALDKLTGHLVDAGVLGVVELKLTEKTKKIAATAYEYKAVHRYVSDDDEWGEIRFDFSAGAAEIVKLADGDMSRTNVFAKIAICQILKLSISELPKKLTIPLELEQEKIRCGS